ncbi:MAG: hypothetical protein C0614_03885 [Desulfuromonas sp.]|nr:MAG: hypothetical protein C0614_03885 [Desulfuromonas sp.]
MTRLKLLKDRLERIRGVENYVLVRHDGEVISHNMNNPDKVASMVAICGRSSNLLKEANGFSETNHIILTRKDRRHFLVFCLSRYFFGVQQIPGTDTQRLASSISGVIREIPRK